MHLCVVFHARKSDVVEEWVEASPGPYLVVYIGVISSLNVLPITKLVGRVQPLNKDYVCLGRFFLEAVIVDREQVVAKLPVVITEVEEDLVGVD